MGYLSKSDPRSKLKTRSELEPEPEPKSQRKKSNELKMGGSSNTNN